MATTVNRENNNALNVLFARAYTLNWEVIVYLVIFLLALFTRFYDLGVRTMSHDESLHTVYSNNLYERGDFQHSPLMHGPILFHFTALSYALFGVDDFSARVYPAVLGVIMVMFPILLRRWLGRSGALLTSIMLLVSPLLVYYNRYIRHDTPSILAAMVMFYCAMMYLSGPIGQRRRAHWLYILSAAMIWNLGSKETAFIYIAIFGAFLTLYWLVRVGQHLYNIKGKIVFSTLIIGMLLAGVAALGMIIVISMSLQAQLSLGDRLNYLGDQLGLLLSGEKVGLAFTSFVAWTGLAMVTMLAIIVAPALWAYRKGKLHLSILDILMGLIAVLLMFSVAGVLSTENITIVNEIQVRESTAGVAVAVGLIAAISAVLIYAAYRMEIIRPFRRQFITLLLIMLALCFVFLVIEEVSHVQSAADETAAPVVPGEGGGDVVVAVSTFSPFPIIIAWVFGIAVVGGLFYAQRRGLWDFLHQFPEFDILLLMGSLILPWLTAIFIVWTHGSAADFAEIGNGLIGLSNVLPVAGAEQVGRFVIGFLAWIPMIAIAITAGLMWNWRRWLVCALIFHAIFAFFFTTVFTNIEGLATGMIYSLQYWLEQQEVRRGSQPQYYYLLVILPFYEFLPIIGSVLAMIAGMVFFWKRQRRYEDELEQLEDVEPAREAVVLGSDPAGLAAITRERDHDEQVETMVSAARERPERWHLKEVPFLLFVAWWAVLNLVAYTLAGEKMPWLGTHMTVPLILLSGWYFGSVLDRLSPTKFTERGWIYLLVLPFLFVGLFQLVAPYLGGEPPFSGITKVELTWTYNWLAALVVTVVAGGVAYWLVQFTGWAHLRQMIALTLFVVLALLTFRSSWLSSFIHHDEATEFLVYAHAGPANKEVTQLLQEMSYRITGGMDLGIVHDDKFSWPGSWYLRDFTNSLYVGSNAPTQQQLDGKVAVIIGDSNRSKFEPLLEDSFQRFDYIRMWWPIQDYFDLNPKSMGRFFSLEDPTSGQLRRGIFDIWWQRDYAAFARAQNKTITLTNWPVADRMYVYIRKDFAAQVWPYGVGDATVLNPFTEIEVNTCAANWEQRSAALAFDTTEQRLLTPIDLTVGPDGRIYVAEDAGSRISIYDQEGRFLSAFGQPGTAAQEGAFFQRPHSVAIAQNGNIYVADTWNFRIRAFTPNFEYITGWGQQLTAGFDAPAQPVDGFWGPRDVTVDSMGRVYVADTGNKRIRVYTADGQHIDDIGSGGAADGQLNEPAGVAIHPDGRVFVADTWNRRVVVYNSDWTFLQNIRVRGWYEELGNRPYLALDPERDLLYVTDPDAGRILIYDTNGECLGSFGQLNQENPNVSQFATIGGVAVDGNGNLYVTDLANGRVLKFDPYERPEVVPIEPLGDQSGVEGNNSAGGGQLPFSVPDSAGQAIPDFLLETTPEVDGLPFLIPQATEEADSNG